MVYSDPYMYGEKNGVLLTLCTRSVLPFVRTYLVQYIIRRCRKLCAQRYSSGQRPQGGEIEGNRNSSRPEIMEAAPGRANYLLSTLG